MDSIKLKLFGSINDPIHGSIKMSTEEMNVIGHPLFRRLHHVRQNSFLYKVFPSAKHTRFEHSIGVMHVASKILSALLLNGESASKAGDLAELESLEEKLGEVMGLGFTLTNIMKEEEIIQMYREVRLAALLHDIGHGPLSHLFDAFAPSTEDFLEILKSDINLKTGYPIILEAFEKMLIDYKYEETKEAENSVTIEHEHVSSYFTYRILDTLEIGEEQEKKDLINNVLTILKPKLALGRKIIEIDGMEVDVLPLLNDIVAGAPIDCDRMDYLKRDSYFAGVPYGNYSEDRILKSFLPFISSTGEHVVARLGLKHSGLHSIENFLQARYEMFVQVYGHKTNEACNFMLNSLVEEEKKDFKIWAGIELDHNEFEDLYVNLTDETFLEKLSNNLGPKGKQTVSCLVDRKLWKRVYETEEFVETHEQNPQLESIMNEAINKFSEADDTLKLFKGDRFPLKDFENAARILEKNSYSYYAVSQTPLNKASQIIESLNKGLRVWRIYSLKQKTEAVSKLAKEEIHPQIKSLQNLGIVK
ncbi:HD domain-containing protein [Planococcus sp. A6]|uniref:HD domain-containing protein n=1 Tax=Planococcus sp. A6 TaxID=2992760 RepID=UPI00237B378B|nr:HD domain-containing protein [Planococcus sp. A6]MDE0581453.1 HD domain-containing protein [Planococcus sp. A6]